MEFLYSWRWFGPNDRITLKEISQVGATTLVNALHQIPVGDVWSLEEIKQRKNLIESNGLKWGVVESLPVSEQIKMQKGDYKKHIENYKISLRNLASQGLHTICYNFMPILDWSRTNLMLEFENGTYTSGFQLEMFAAFDIFILKRLDADKDYNEETKRNAHAYFNKLDEAGRKKLKATILYGLPGSLQEYSLDEFRDLLKNYQGIDQPTLKSHLSYFLNEIIPVAEEGGIKMAIHPDDPPWNLLGLPRIVSTIDDLHDIVNMIKSPSNGITLCTGSLGVGHFNNVPEIVSQMAPNIHFVHLRNVIRDKQLNFKEENFFEGDIDMIEVVKNLVKEGLRRKAELNEEWQLPVRPDHGHQILEDIGKENYPGYSLYGRMKNLAEIKGLTQGLLKVL
jgi:mannonate dehydratase